MNERVAGTLVDTCVLLDVVTQDEKWFSRSAAALAAAADEGPLVINQIIYAEASVRYASIEEFDELLEDVGFVRSPFSWSVAFLAGKCHVEYRRRGGVRTSPLPDFFIGAHAATMKLRLLTRDDARYRTYFPTVELIVP
ncbi:type II toxin-antitoxin system VapC family toxin [Lentzea tibetensis]|uniref:Type II toxin-antitoxin system VapC family toxin n=1 Tax=Lentzea tibetensis TaxID=2591470 RepID=A0A563EKF7_9PSEU|nr:type II toxin-antitoxin system VapC family toxin [Lentzea tibetensis]TWP47448.1 type II toxin-antitoxin system VapC family toxin [Lentzea tibetensis]